MSPLVGVPQFTIAGFNQYCKWELENTSAVGSNLYFMPLQRCQFLTGALEQGVGEALQILMTGKWDLSWVAQGLLKVLCMSLSVFMSRM